MTGYDPYRDGITNSLLQRWIICRHRFWLYAVRGLQPRPRFSHKMEFGNMMHIAHEHYASSGGDPAAAEAAIRTYAYRLTEIWHHDESVLRDIQNWMMYAIHMFALYREVYAKRTKGVTFIEQEKTFKVPCTLPSGRTIPLRGKRDGIIKRKGKKKPMLREYKHRGQVNEDAVTRDLIEDLQTGIYLKAAMLEGYKELDLLYDIVLRPLSEPSSPKPRKGDSDAAFIDRVMFSYERRDKKSKTKYPIKDFPKHYFYQWEITLTPQDTEAFCRTTLDPYLEQFCDWWDSIKANPKDPWHSYYTVDSGGFTPWGTPIDVEAKLPNRLHAKRPSGVFDSIAQGFADSYADVIATGDTSNLVPVKTLFPELEV